MLLPKSNKTFSSIADIKPGSKKVKKKTSTVATSYRAPVSPRDDYIPLRSKRSSVTREPINILIGKRDPGPG